MRKEREGGQPGWGGKDIEMEGLESPGRDIESVPNRTRRPLRVPDALCACLYLTSGFPRGISGRGEHRSSE